MELREGYKQTEIGVIPEDWDVIKLGDITSYTKGFAFKSADYTKDGVRIIRVSDTLFDKITNKTPVFIDSSKVNEFKKWSLYTNDLILSTVGSKPPMYDSMVGNVVRVTNKHCGSLLNQNAVFLRVKKEYSQVYLYYCFKREEYIEHIEKIYRGNANQASITLVELFKYEIPLPPTLEEQKAIATALSDVDHLITNLNDLIAKKKAIKQGAMQRLLTPPHLGGKRLSGFDGEWVEKSLGALCLLITKGTTPTSIGMNFTDEGVNFIKAESISKVGLIIPDKVAHINVDTHDLLSRSKMQENDVLFTIAGVLGRIGIITKDILPANTNQAVAIIRLKKDYNNHTRFIFHYLRTNFIAKHIEAISVQGAQANFSLTDLNNLPMVIPNSMVEQEAIANVLTDIDKELEELETKKQKYQDIKQGMMQELLTGKTRLV